MPYFIVPDNTPKELVSLGPLEMVARNCQLQPYTKLETINTFKVTGKFIAYASPDSTYAVTRRLLDAATKEIIIGIYDFTADYIKEILLSAMRRGVKLSLMLDIDSQQEQTLFDELKRFGCTAVEAPSCASQHVHYFSSSHEKVIIIDQECVLVQSGNYSNNSIPFNEKDGGDPANFITGNRDMGIAIHSKPLAAFFRKLLLSDMKLETDAEVAEALTASTPKPQAPELVEKAPQLLPAKLFPSKVFTPTQPIKVRPVLTPDNYMDVIPGFIESATQSIYIENQYIRSNQPGISKLLSAIKKAKDATPTLDVRIVLGKLFSQADVQKEKINIANIAAKFGLVLDKNIRYIDTKRFVHCHNKLIIVDGATTLISSQNWSDTAVGTNREAGVLIEDPAIAQYYTQIFESDWRTAQKTIPTVSPGPVDPESLKTGRFVTVVAADYQEM